MKVYVDELPKCCEECEYFTSNHCSKDGRNFCLLARMPFYNTKEEREKTRGQHKDSLSDFDCPLQSIAEHTKQVRKEVCEEIKNKILKDEQVWRYPEYEKSDVIELVLDIVDESLDQI